MSREWTAPVEVMLRTARVIALLDRTMEDISKHLNLTKLGSATDEDAEAFIEALTAFFSVVFERVYKTPDMLTFDVAAMKALTAIVATVDKKQEETKNYDRN